LCQPFRERGESRDIGETQRPVEQLPTPLRRIERPVERKFGNVPA